MGISDLSCHPVCLGSREGREYSVAHLRARLHCELFEYALRVMADRVAAYSQQLRDFSIGGTCRQQQCDFPFPSSQFNIAPVKKQFLQLRGCDFRNH